MPVPTSLSRRLRAARPLRRLTATLVAVAALAGPVGLAACSGGGHGNTPAAPTNPPPTAPLPPQFAAAASTEVSLDPLATAVVPSTTSPYALPSSDALVEDLTHQLVSSQAGGPLPLTEPQARCVSSGLVTKLGMETLVRLGGQTSSAGQLDIARLSPEEREKFADALLGCIDLNQLLVKQMGDSLGLPPAALACVAKKLTDDGTLGRLLRQAVVNGTDPAASESALAGPMVAALSACLSPADLAKLSRR